MVPLLVQGQDKLPIIQALYNKYSENFKEIGAGRAERIAAAELDYMDEVMRLEELAYEAGNLDAVLSMQASKNYFKTHMEPQKDDVNGPLAEAYDKYRKEVSRAHAYGENDYQRLKNDYLNELQNLEIKMVKDRRLDVAMAARKEAEAFRRAGLEHFYRRSVPKQQAKEKDDKQSNKKSEYKNPF